MRTRLLVCAVVCAFILTIIGSVSAEPDKPTFDPAKIKGAEKLSEDAKKILQKNGLVIMPKEYRQIFEVYEKYGPPNYITVDSVIETFRVIFEECLSLQERGVVGELEEGLRKIHEAVDQIVASLPDKQPGENAEKNARLAREAVLFLSAYTSITGRLLDGTFPTNAAVKEVVEGEVQMIKEAAGLKTSPLTGRPRDYSRFKVRGKYTQDEEMASYFRSVFFISRTTFHVESQRETLAAAMLNLAVKWGGLDKEGPGKLYEKIFGKPDDLAPWEYEDAIEKTVPWEVRMPWVNNLEKGKDVLLLAKHVRPLQGELRKLPDPRTTDEWFSVEEFPQWRKLSKGLRLIGAAYLPDEELLLNTSSGLPAKGRVLPSGLDVGVLLGHGRAKTLLAKKESEELAAKVVEVAKSIEISEKSLYGRFLSILKSYVKEIESRSDMQDVFKTVAWQDKTLNTVLCGWAQLQHSASLAGKKNVTYPNGGSSGVVGGVEPVPRFFLNLAELLCDFEDVLYAQAKPSLRQRARQIMQFMSAFRQERERAGRDKDKFWTRRKFLEKNPHFADIEEALYLSWGHTPAATPEEFEKAAKRIVEGTPVQGDEHLIQGTIKATKAVPEYKKLIRFCIQLAKIAQKQLDGVEFDEKEKRLIRLCGGVLGELHFYKSDAWHHPRDDMPVVSDVFTNGLEGKVLLSGIGRARCMKIVLRDHATGKLVLCNAAVALYHEHISSSPMSDEEWREKLKEKDGPKPATWLDKYVAKPSGTPEKGK